jgi:hypothetical protein
MNFSGSLGRFERSKPWCPPSLLQYGMVFPIGFPDANWLVQQPFLLLADSHPLLMPISLDLVELGRENSTLKQILRIIFLKCQILLGLEMERYKLSLLFPMDFELSQILPVGIAVI